MHCPFCNAANPCEHHLVSIDLTFREILGGPLSEWLSARLAELYEREESNEDFCVSDSLEDILYDVSVASDGERGGLRRCSRHVIQHSTFLLQHGRACGGRGSNTRCQDQRFSVVRRLASFLLRRATTDCLVIVRNRTWSFERYNASYAGRRYRTALTLLRSRFAAAQPKRLGYLCRTS